MDLISIIVPIYNVEKYLEKCIDSIRNQTLENIEIILVDDGSTDKSGDICDEYQKKDKRIRVIHKKNGGLSDARNAGIKNANGKYFGFIDSDDYIEKNMFEYLYKLIVDNNADISMCNFKFVPSNEIGLKLIKDVEIFCKEDAIRELIIGQKIKDYAWNKLYKKELFDEIQYPFGKKMEDVGTTYKLFSNSETIVLGNELKYNYLVREGSILNDGNENLFIDKFELMIKRYHDLITQYPDMTELDINILDNMLYMYRHLADTTIKSLEEKLNFYEEFKKIYKRKHLYNKKLDAKMKLKLFLFNFNKKIYRKI